jgi:hypothetical protein
LLVVVEGAASCPSPTQVGERLAGLLPEGERAAPDRAVVSAEARAVRIELFDGKGARLGEKRIDDDAPCADLAAASAVLIAAWEASLRPGSVPPPSLPPLLPHSRVHLDLGAGVALSLAQGGSSFGVTVEGALAGRSGRGRGFAARIAIVAPLLQPHVSDFPVAGEHAEWSRYAASLGVRYRFAPGFLRIDPHLGLALALIVVDGVGVPNAQRATAFTAGLDAGIRVGLDLGPAIVWGGVSLFWYPARQVAQVDNGGPTVDLPSVEGLVTVGVAFGTGR